MHIVILAWLFVTFTMALTLDSAAAGIALFVVVGLGPVALYCAIALRRRQAGSMRERQVDQRDDRDAEADR